MDRQGIFMVDDSVIDKLIEEIRTLRPRLLIKIDVGFGGKTKR